MASFQGHQLEHYADAQLSRFIREAPSLQHHEGILLLSDTHVAKRYAADRAEDANEAIELACRLGVRAPAIKRTVEVDDITWCIMDKVAGVTLEEAWSELGLLKSIVLALQLRAFIGILRSATSSTAGSLATGMCRSFWLEDRYRLPARATMNNIHAFINFWMDFVSLRREIRKTASQHRELPKHHHLSPASGLVFTHHDLAPRNILLHPSGDLWLLDWDYAGWYPVCFEFAAMHNFNIPRKWNRWARIRWNLFCWIAAGFYGRDARVLRIVQSRCARFPAARRFNIKANGYASAIGRRSDSS
ncbi:Protein kinase-like domain protein [Niveomyces insectorum RCEF 264]|uniref:Protein kinase-like domain protein n=1 Tax=Niveomyces insectorum RCEF 264 TaxID=1081102 RepID=A0A167QCN6_9HYPO|nr:Protein kinase-like domain protein [Niveomyces insectorum RCEF 264]